MDLLPKALDARPARPRAPVGDTTADRQIFGKMLLVFGCIGSDFCKKICVLRCSSSKTSYRIRKCVFHLPSLVEPERLTGSDKWAMPETRANLIVVRPLLARAPLTAKLISRAT